MASASDIRAGRAFVELYVKGEALNFGLARASKRLADFASDVATFLSPSRMLKGLGEGIASIGKRVTMAGVGMGSAFVYPIKAASDAVETVNKFEAVFGQQAAAARRFGDELSGVVGRSKYQILDSMSAFQAFFVGMGFDPARARGMSEQLQALAIDFGSFFNVSDEEASQRFIAALSGSGEVLDRFGINVKQAALQQELLRMGLKKTWTEVTEAEKAQARFNIILRTMTEQGAVGDAAKTAGSLANRWKALKGEMRDAAVVVGQALIPVVTPLVQKVVEIAKAIGEWAARNQEFIANLGGLVVKVTLAGAAIYAFGKYVVLLGGIVSVIFLLAKLYFVFTVLIPVLHAVASALGVTTMGFAALRLVLTTFGPAILAASAALVTITALAGALAVAFSNAKLKGISFGESVLDLANQITGAENAYTRLRDTLDQQKESGRIVGRAEEAIRGNDAAGLRAEIENLRKQREEVAARLAAATPGTRPRGGSGFSVYGQAMAEAAANTGPAGTGTAATEEMRGLEMEAKRLDLLIDRLTGKLLGVEWRGALAEWAGMYTGIASQALDAGRNFGHSFVEGVKYTIKAVGDVVYGQMMVLRRARAEGIEDSLEREIALIRLSYEERIKAEKAQGRPIGILQQARDQEIANARGRAERERADRLENLDEQVARAEIEATKKGIEKERALLEMDRQRELRETTDPAAMERINRLYDLRAGMIGGRERARDTEGTFSGWAARLMGGAGSPAEQTARNTAATAKHLQHLPKKLADAVVNSAAALGVPVI